jgi:hypothetical protein
LVGVVGVVGATGLRGLSLPTKGKDNKRMTTTAIDTFLNVKAVLGGDWSFLSSKKLFANERAFSNRLKADLSFSKDF